MKIYYKANKTIEIGILSVAILVAVVMMIVYGKNFWFILPYIILEAIILYFLLNVEYRIENQCINLKYGFITFKAIRIHSIQKIIICDKQKGEPKITPLRIEIHYQKDKKLVVSPKETVSFVENIERLNPGIEII